MQRDINAAVILIQITHTALWVLYTYILLMMLTLSWLRNAVTAGFSPVESSVCFAPAHSSVHMLLSLWDSDWCKTTRSSSSVSYFPPIPLFFSFPRVCLLSRIRLNSSRTRKDFQLRFKHFLLSQICLFVSTCLLLLTFNETVRSLRLHGRRSSK